MTVARHVIAMLGVLAACHAADRTTTDFSHDSPARNAAVQQVSSAAVAVIVASNRPAVVLVEKNRSLWLGDSTASAMSQPAWAEFVRRSRDPGVVPPLVGDPIAHRVLHRELRGNVTDTAVIALSAVGFSSSGDEAVVYIDYRCGTRCGVAMISSFRRAGAEWVLSKADTVSRQ